MVSHSIIHATQTFLQRHRAVPVCWRQVLLACLPGIVCEKICDVLIGPTMHHQADMLCRAQWAAQCELVGIRWQRWLSSRVAIVNHSLLARTNQSRSRKVTPYQDQERKSNECYFGSSLLEPKWKHSLEHLKMIHAHPCLPNSMHGYIYIYIYIYIYMNFMVLLDSFCTFTIIYPLVNIQKAIENDHGNSWFSH